MSIQRYVPLGGDNMPDPNGEYVTYADHVEEVVRWRIMGSDQYGEGHRIGWRDGAEGMRAACLAAVSDWVADDWQPDMDHNAIVSGVHRAVREVKP